MNKIEKALLTVTVIGLIIFITMGIVTKNEDGAYGFAFGRHNEFYGKILAFNFLVIFLIMVSVTLFLVSQTQAKKRAELGIQETASFKKENLTLVITLFSFSLGYGLRFAYDGYLGYYYEKRGEWFASYLTYDIMSLVEGTTFMAILLYHNKNFKIRKPVNDLNEQ